MKSVVRLFMSESERLMSEKWAAVSERAKEGRRLVTEIRLSVMRKSGR